MTTAAANGYAAFGAPANQVRTPGADRPLFTAYLHTPTEHESGQALNSTNLVVYPGEPSDANLDAAGARRFRAELAAFLPRLDAMIQQLDGEPPTEGDGEARPSARIWTLRTVNGVTITGYLPAWSQNDPTEDNVPGDRLEMRLDDFKHARYYESDLVAKADLNDRGERSIGETAMLCPQIQCAPFHEDPANRVPTVSVELIEGYDHWIEGLDPQGVADLAAKLRTQAALLDQVASDLAAAREDWDANGGTR